MAPKVNKRLVILLTIMVVVWAVAIFTLVSMNHSIRQSNQLVVTGSGNSKQAADGSVPSLPSSGISPIESAEVKQATTTEMNEGRPAILPTESDLFEASNVDFFSPYYVDLSYIDDFYGEFSGLIGTSQGIQDATSPDFQYIGYISMKNGPISIRKIFLLLNGDYVSGFENELIAGRYKPIRVFSTYMIFLDILDGKIKKVGYFAEQL